MRNWMSRLALLRGKLSISFKYFLDGMAPSMSLSLGYRDEDFHVAAALDFSTTRTFLKKACLLFGIGFRKGAGSRRHRLDPFSVASLASRSASSFPVTPCCPGTHRMVSFICLCHPFVTPHHLRNISQRYCVCVARANPDRCMEPTLSAAMVVLLTLASCRMSSRPSMNATPSASGTVC